MRREYECDTNNVILLTPKRQRNLFSSLYFPNIREKKCATSIFLSKQEIQFLMRYRENKKKNKENKQVCNDDYKRIIVNPFDKITWYLV